MSCRKTFAGLLIFILLFLNSGLAVEDRIGPKFPIDKIQPACVKVVVPSGHGSGFFVSPNGHVVTNFHVINNEPKAYIETSDRKKYNITGLLAYSIKQDLVLLETSAKESPFLEIGDPEQITLDMSICIIGHPNDKDWTLTKGFVAGHRMNREMGCYEIQFSADIFPGSSGSPIVGTDGKVYGVATWRQFETIIFRNNSIVLNPSEVLKFGVSADSLIKMLVSKKSKHSLAEIAALSRRIQLTNFLNLLAFDVYDSIQELTGDYKKIVPKIRNRYDRTHRDIRGNPKIKSSTIYLTNTGAFRNSAAKALALRDFFIELNIQKTGDKDIDKAFENSLLALKHIGVTIDRILAAHRADGMKLNLTEQAKLVHHEFGRATERFYIGLDEIYRANKKYSFGISQPHTSIFTGIQASPSRLLLFKKNCDKLYKSCIGIFEYRMR